jgi:protease PrsW
MTLFLASILLGIIPMVIYALIVWRLDRWEKEPLPLVLAAFCWGAVPSVIFAIIAQNVLNFPAVIEEGEELSIAGELYQASLVAPVKPDI